ncbi:MAG: glycosyltransferase [Victivallales bacterium]|nr:glycosyltransferase [Victivallales bacterium]
MDPSELNGSKKAFQGQWPMISVIVPVFRVEKYLEECVSSILAQSYANLEIILVDDGSDDNCPAICDGFQANDNRVKVIHKKNGGLSQARNYGLRIATGDFIGFVDGDDWIESGMYEAMLSAMLETGADIAVCNYHKESSDSKSIQRGEESSERKLYSSEEAMRIILSSTGFIRNTVWNKLYRRSVLANVIFPEGKLYEDTPWTGKVVCKAKKVICLASPLYHYLVRSDSLSHDDRQIVRRTMDKNEMLEQRLAFIRENCPDLEKLALCEFLNQFCIGLGFFRDLISYRSKILKIKCILRLIFLHM